MISFRERSTYKDLNGCRQNQIMSWLYRRAKKSKYCIWSTYNIFVQREKCRRLPIFDHSATLWDTQGMCNFLILFAYHLYSTWDGLACAWKYKNEILFFFMKTYLLYLIAFYQIVECFHSYQEHRYWQSMCSSHCPQKTFLLMINF